MHFFQSIANPGISRTDEGGGGGCGVGIGRLGGDGGAGMGWLLGWGCNSRIWRNINFNPCIPTVLLIWYWCLPVRRFVITAFILLLGVMVGPSVIVRPLAILHVEDEDIAVYNSSSMAALWSKCGARDCPSIALNETAIEPQGPLELNSAGDRKHTVPTIFWQT